MINMGLLDLKINLMNDINQLKGKTVLNIFSGRLENDQYSIIVTYDNEIIMLCADYSESNEDSLVIKAMNHQTIFEELIGNYNLQKFLKQYGAFDDKAFRKMVHELKKKQQEEYLAKEEEKERKLYEELKKKYGKEENNND